MRRREEHPLSVHDAIACNAPDHHSHREKLIHVPFKIEPNGSQIIFYDPEEDYSAEEAARAEGPQHVFRELTEIHAQEEDGS